MKQISTWHIYIKGQVQGVGFRPFVYQLAKQFSLTGWVKNAADGVHIEFNANQEVSNTFYSQVLSKAPHLSHITAHFLTEKFFVEYLDFKIMDSSSDENPVLLLSPDFAVCEDCIKEISEKENRRYSYAFTTCTQCGPRYSIIKQLPYDREHTAMQLFKMCSHCNEEYDDPTNHRHYAQTNSCPDCAVAMNLFDNRQDMIEDEQLKISSRICDLWNDGKIVAIKGIGGYLLTCDATNKDVIIELRKRKLRPTKPFASMFADIDALQNVVEINEQEKKELKSAAAPIVLLQLKENARSTLAINEIAPELSNIGVMLPYTPLYQLLLQQFSKPIIATSGNASNAPIVFDDEVALKELNLIADYILVNNREIITPQDDSVISYSRYAGKRIMLRRSRGIAPFYSGENIKLPQTTILALGALLKSTFSLLHHQIIHVSQYLGDTDNYDAQKNFEKTVHHFLDLFQTKPEVVLMDKHPGYSTTQFGEQQAKKWSSQLIKVQHHEAHFASVLGENNLFNEADLILGVTWDGTGFGDDGQIWGGEFFIFGKHCFSRVNHFDYFNHFLGDKMSMQPRLSAFSLCHEIEEATPIIQPKFSPTEWNNYKQLIKTNELKTSSVGRIFDAVASLLGLIDKASYEGEAAMLLEEQAHTYFESEINIPDEWLEDEASQNPLSTPSLLKKIVRKINEGKAKSEIAAWFHVQLILAVQNVAAKNHCQKICFSGGVFQNGLLLDLVLKILGEKYIVYFNKDLSPNDENISFGQLMWYSISKMY